MFIVRDGYFRFRPEDYADYEVANEDGTVVPFQISRPLESMMAYAIVPRIRITNAASVNGRIYFREVPIYSEASRGFEFLLAPELVLRPTTAFQFDLSYTYSRLSRRQDDSVFRPPTSPV
jgi:hypothetical protein